MRQVRVVDLAACETTHEALASRSCESRASRRRCTRARSGGVRAVAMRRETRRLLVQRAQRPSRAASPRTPRLLRILRDRANEGVAPIRLEPRATNSTSRAKPGMAAQLGLPAIPVERSTLQSWKTLRAAWERSPVRRREPEALDTDAIGPCVRSRVQGERVARPRGRAAARGVLRRRRGGCERAERPRHERRGRVRGERGRRERPLAYDLAVVGAHTRTNARGATTARPSARGASPSLDAGSPPPP